MEILTDCCANCHYKRWVGRKFWCRLNKEYKDLPFEDICDDYKED